MKRLIALGISIGILAGLFTWVGFSITNLGSWKAPLVVWVGFAAWACFYAAGGRAPSLLTSGGSIVSGVVWGWLIVWAAGHIRSGNAAVLGLVVALAAFLMCVQATLPPLAFIPATFVGAATFFGNQTLFWSTLLSVVVGTLLAYVSEIGADVVEAKALGVRPPHEMEHRPVSAA